MSETIRPEIVTKLFVAACNGMAAEAVVYNATANEALNAVIYLMKQSIEVALDMKANPSSLREVVEMLWKELPPEVVS